ncbi:discoidin domain-containing protein [Actinospica acidithermotolerans]|uniref:discoidin domain-containing protein n=1 Tax=Actinospica acidithermotolerans TaxID=2828514 RepID=UPI0020128E6F|nr:discoidin domain-containing protein [Actinospica acidithermotolerans]
MPITRRKLLLSAAALPAAQAALGALSASPAAAASAAGDVVGKITVGYQGWFACIGDGAPIDAWWHWSQNEAQPPSPSNQNLKAWPDMTIYDTGYTTAYANLNNGGAPNLFSSYDQQVIDAHCSLMQANAIDTIALQRFDPNGSEGPTRNAITAKLNTSAQAHGRKFYIMYDATGWTNMATEMPADWTNVMSQYTSSSAYAHQNGKPVVGIWGFGFNDANHPWAASDCLSVIQWFQSQGCYVMGGVPTYWRTGVNDSRSGYLSVYSAFNMISPWMVGRIGTSADSDSFYTNVNVGDQAYCNANGIDYQPCVLPGDLSANQRAHGDFMWEQFYNMVRVGAQGIYISMFDEFGEGNQIVNTAPTQAYVPSNSGLNSLDEDGTACSADYYLRLTADGGRMLKGQIALTNVRPTQPVVSGGGTTPGTNLALNKPATGSGYTQAYTPANAVDGNTSTYWESTDNAFPQWLQVDLGSPVPVGRIVMDLPPSTSWATRTQTITIQGSTDGSTYTTLAASAGYTFNPSTGNTATATFAAAPARYVKLTFTANTGWPAGQLSELQVYGS